jgi:hypothetical protein
MTAFMWQVLEVMTLGRFLPFPIILSLVYLVPVLRPWPWGWLLAPAIPSWLLFQDWLSASDRCMLNSRPRCRRPFPLWEELPAYAVAGLLATLLFYLIFFGLTYAVRRLDGEPGRWRYDPAKLPKVNWYFVGALVVVSVLQLIFFLNGPAIESIITFVIGTALGWLLD